MTAIVGGDQRTIASFAHTSPLVLLAVAMPWLLEAAIVRGVTVVAPAHRSLMTEGIVDVLLYPILTGSAVLVGLYVLLDPATRRSVFPTTIPSRRDLLVVLVGGPVAFGLGAIATAITATVLGVDPSGVASDGGIGPVWILLFVLNGAVFAPLVEETLFRGLLLGYLLDRDVPTVLAGGAVAVAFGLLHYYAGVPRIAGATVLGVVLVAARLRYDSLSVPVGIHAVNNLVALAVIVLGYG